MIKIIHKMISIYIYCCWVENVSFQSPLVEPCIHTHTELYKGLIFEARTRLEPDGTTSRLAGFLKQAKNRVSD